jgi:hypothetical protein
LVEAIEKLVPCSSGGPPAMLWPPACRPSVANGLHVDQASIRPRVKAASPSAEQRQRADHLHRRVDHRVTRPAEPG